jgi:hypothetical protein
MSATLEQLTKILSRKTQGAFALLNALIGSYDEDPFARGIGQPRRTLSRLGIDFRVSSLDSIRGPAKTESEGRTSDNRKQGGQIVVGRSESQTTRWSIAFQNDRKPRLLVANAGCGKTFCSRWAAVWSGRRMLKLLAEDSTAVDTLIYPIWLSASDLTSQGGATLIEKLQEWWKARRSRLLPDELRSFDVLGKALAESPARVFAFVDSLDEVTDRDQVTALRTLLKQSGTLGNRIVITSRPAAELVAFIAPHCRTYEIAPLLRPEQWELVSKLLPDGPENEVVTQEILDRIHGTPQLAACGNTPLLLRLFCAVRKGGVPLDSPAALYDRIVDHILKGEWRSCRIDWTETLGGGDLAEARSILRAVFFQLMMDEPGSGGFSWERWTAAWKRARRTKPIIFKGIEAKLFLSRLIDSGLIHGLNDPGGSENEYQSLHKTFIEYLAAKELHLLGPNVWKRLLREHLGFADGVRLGCDARFEQTLDFLAGMPGDAEELIALLDQCAFEKGDDYFRRLLSYQVRWASIGGKEVSVAVRQRLVKEVVDAGFGANRSKCDSLRSVVRGEKPDPVDAYSQQVVSWIGADDVMRGSAIAAFRASRSTRGLGWVGGSEAADAIQEIIAEIPAYNRRRKKLATSASRWERAEEKVRLFWARNSPEVDRLKWLPDLDGYCAWLVDLANAESSEMESNTGRVVSWILKLLARPEDYLSPQQSQWLGERYRGSSDFGRVLSRVGSREALDLLCDRSIFTMSNFSGLSRLTSREEAKEWLRSNVRLALGSEERRLSTPLDSWRDAAYEMVWMGALDHETEVMLLRHAFVQRIWAYQNFAAYALVSSDSESGLEMVKGGLPILIASIGGPPADDRWERESMVLAMIVYAVRNRMFEEKERIIGLHNFGQDKGERVRSPGYESTLTDAIRLAVIEYVKAIGDDSDIPILWKMVEDACPYVAAAAASAVAMLGGRAEHEELARLYESWFDEGNWAIAPINWRISLHGVLWERRASRTGGLPSALEMLLDALTKYAPNQAKRVLRQTLPETDRPSLIKLVARFGIRRGLAKAWLFVDGGDGDEKSWPLAHLHKSAVLVDLELAGEWDNPGMIGAYPDLMAQFGGQQCFEFLRPKCLNRPLQAVLAPGGCSDETAALWKISARLRLKIAGPPPSSTTK